MLLTGVAPLSIDDRAWHAPDAHVELTEGHALAARCSIWWRSVPSLPGHRLGLIGHYAASDAPSGQLILGRACERLRQEGCTLAVGPLDGSTWRRYRFVIDRGDRDERGNYHFPFFLEPDQPDSWPGYFEAEGFRVLTMYRSALATDLDRWLETAETTREKDLGISMRSIDLNDPDAELRRLYRVATASFSTNYLYTPIAELEFVRQYRAVLPFVRCELVSIAERDGDPIGFLFAIPDALEARRTPGGAIETIIVKTVAVAPECRGMGLGTLLVHRTHAVAARLGFSRAIHAMMHDGNVSQRISGDARTIRRYALYARPL
jgi:GNAT superfamily N-acetyltransferase